jgi:hypothetical protein
MIITLRAEENVTMLTSCMRERNLSLLPKKRKKKMGNVSYQLNRGIF